MWPQFYLFIKLQQMLFAFPAPPPPPPPSPKKLQYAGAVGRLCRLCHAVSFYLFCGSKLNFEVVHVDSG